MRPSSLIYGFLLLFIIGTGCAHGMKIRGVLDFGPAGHQVLCATGDGRLQLYDLATNRPVWEIPASSPGFVSFSPKRQYFALWEGTYDGTYSGQLSLLRSGDGTRTATVKRVSNRLVRPGPQHVAVSDDGRLLASSLEPGVELLDAETGASLFRHESKVTRALSFEPGGRRLAATTGAAPGDRATVVMGREASGWRVLSAFKDTRHHWWLPDGLVLLRAEGITLWNGTRERSLVPQPGLEETSVIIAEDGRSIASWNAEQTVAVHAVVDGRRIYSGQGLGKPATGRIAGTTLYLLAERPKHLLFLVEVDLLSGSVTKETNLGAWGERSADLPIYTGEGRAWHQNFAAYLGPGATYLQIARQGVSEFRRLR
jgi:hypothetical protein